MVEPGDWWWNDDHPDVGPRHTVENGKPDVEGKEGEWSEQSASEIPDIVDNVIHDSRKAIHVEVFAKAAWVQLGSRCLCIVVPESVPSIATSNSLDESFTNERINWKRLQNELESVDLAKDIFWLEERWHESISHAIAKYIHIDIDVPSLVESLLIFSRGQLPVIWLITERSNLDWACVSDCALVKIECLLFSVLISNAIVSGIELVLQTISIATCSDGTRHDSCINWAATASGWVKLDCLAVLGACRIGALYQGHASASSGLRRGKEHCRKRQCQKTHFSRHF